MNPIDFRLLVVAVSRLGKSPDKSDRSSPTDTTTSVTSERASRSLSTTRTMTTTPARAGSTSAVRGRDWRLRIIYDKDAAIPTAAELARVRCPFEITPEATPSILPECTENLRHFVTTEGSSSLPWSGYYAIYYGRKLAVANAFGVWFEIRQRGAVWETIRPARTTLQLKNWPLEGIDMVALAASGEPITVPRLYGTRAPTHDSTDDEEEPTRPTEPKLSQRGPHRPRGTGDEPFTLGNLDDDTPAEPDGWLELEGDPPETFEGDRSRTLAFLTRFKLFMRMNNEANIARDPVKKSAYFLSLIDGPKVKGWVNRQRDWLDKVEADPTRRMTVWQALEQEFKSAFDDYAGRKRAQEEIRKLRMKEGELDQYIANFHELAYRGRFHIHEPGTLRFFVQGLPTRLVESCTDLETFEQWVEAAQQHEKNWLQKRSLRESYRSSQQNDSPCPGNPTRGQFFWRRQNQGNAQGQAGRAPTRQFTPRDPNAMDTSTTVRKAMTKSEKQKYWQEGRCFECSKQGHFAQDCLGKKTCARGATT